MNKYIDVTMPWSLAKDESKKEKLAAVMYNLAEGLRIISVLISPYMPETSDKMAQQLGITDPDLRTWESILSFGALADGTKVQKGAPLFPRIDVAKEIEALEALTKKPAPEPEIEHLPEITVDDFAKVELLTAKVVKCEEIKRSKKLLKLTLDVGGKERQVLSGIKEAFKPEDLIGKTVIVVANLKPTKLCGELSEGMILAAGEGSDIHLITTDAKSGERVR